MSVSQQDVKAQVSAMQQDLAEAQIARKRTAHTKVAGSLIVVLLIVAFTLMLKAQVEKTLADLQEDSTINPEQTKAQELLYARLGGQATVDQALNQAKQTVVKRLRDTAEAAQEDPQIREMVQGLWADVAVPAIRKELNDQGPKIMGMAKEAGEDWTNSLQEMLEAKVQAHLQESVEKQRETLIASGLDEETIDGVIAKIREQAETAAEKMVTARLKAMQPDIKAIEEARNGLVAKKPANIDNVHPVYLLARLLGYKLIELPIYTEPVNDVSSD